MLKAGAALCFAPAKSILKIAGPARSFNSQLPPRKMITPFTSRPIEREECVLDLKKPVQPEQVFVAAVEVKNEHLVQDDFKSLQKSVAKLEDTANSSSSDGNDWSDSKWQEERERRRERMEKNTKIAGFVMVGSAAAGAVSFALYYGRAERDRDGNIIHDQYSGALLAPFYRIYDSIWKWRDYVVEPSRNVLLPDPLPAPYLQPKYTIVIEMKNILVKPDWTYKTGYRFQKRPGLDYFLNIVGYPNFEVVIYTSESLTTAGPVLEAMDPNQRIMFKLFRDCTKYSEGHHKKDLSKLNRDLSKVIYIDFDANSGSLNPENMLMVPEWKGNNDDLSLVDLAELLKTIHLSDVEDVRPTIQYYSQFSNPAAEFKRRAAYVAAQQALGNEQQMEDPPVKKYAGRLFGYRRHMQI